MNISELGCSLSEIYVASQKNGTTPPIYATTKGYLYCSVGVWGKCVTIGDFIRAHSPWYVNNPPSTEQILHNTLTAVFESVVLTVYGERQKRLQDALLQLNATTFDHTYSEDQQKKNLNDHIKGETNGLIEELQVRLQIRTPLSEILSPDQRRTMRQIYYEFQAYILPFWEKFLDQSHHWQDHLIGKLQPGNAIMQGDFFNVVKSEIHYTLFECIVKVDVPLTALAKLNNPACLLPADKKALKKWTDAIAQCSNKLTPVLIANALQDVVMILNLHHKNPITLFDLLSWLYQLHCPILLKEDHEHMNWREGLKSGDAIMCNHHTYHLGNELLSDKIINNAYKVFKLQNFRTQAVVKIASNRLALLMNKKDDSGWGFAMVETIDCDLQGRCTIVEELEAPLSQHEWTSTQWRLNSTDQHIALVFANHIRHMVASNAMPADLSLNHLMWKGDILKSTHAFSKVPFDYNTVEGYCIACAKSNTYVLQFIMSVSGLEQHPVAIYYRKKVNYVLQTGKTNLLIDPLSPEEQPKQYESHVEELCQQVLACRDVCFKYRLAKLRADKKGPQVHEINEIQTTVFDRLCYLHSQHPTPGVWSNDLFIKQVADSFENTMWPPPDPLETQLYWQENFKLMRQYEETAKKVSN